MPSFLLWFWVNVQIALLVLVTNMRIELLSLHFDFSWRPPFPFQPSCLPPPVINMLTQHLGSTKLFFVVQLELQGYIKCTLGVTRDRPLYAQTWVSNTANYRSRPVRAGVDGRRRNMMYVLRPLPLVNRWKGGEAYLETKTPQLLGATMI